jgi:glycosyltransferase involved in cell wall biosynthesis
MRICYISHSNSHFTQPYVDYFARQGHEVHLVSVHQLNLDNAVNHHPLKKQIDPESNKLSYCLALPKIRAIVRSLRPEIVHAHYLTSNGVLAAFSKWRPLVVSLRGSDIHPNRNPIRRLAARYALRHADLVNPVSRSFQEELIKLGVSSDKILTLSQGVEPRQFFTDRSYRRPGPVRLVCTRSLAPRYNCLRIVHALSILMKRSIPFHCTFAATGPEQSHLEQEVTRDGLSNRITFLNGYSQDNLPSIIGDADIYVSAKDFDGTSISLLEAMASGAFSVVSDIPGNREWLTGHGDSLLFDPSNTLQLSRCLELAIVNNALREAAVSINRQRVIAYGDRQKNMAILAEAYRMLIDQFSQGSPSSNVVGAGNLMRQRGNRR